MIRAATSAALNIAEGSTGDDQRPRFIAVFGQGRYAGPTQNLDGVKIIHLVGDGEGDDREIGQRTLRFDGQDRFIPGGR